MNVSSAAILPIADLQSVLPGDIKNPHIQTAQLKLCTSQHTITEKNSHRANLPLVVALAQGHENQTVCLAGELRRPDGECQLHRTPQSAGRTGARYIHRIITKAVSPFSTWKN
jgi:hypothetical protein